MKPRIVILISGRGSNMAALLAADLPLEIAAVISNRPGAAGLALAATRGVAAEVVDHQAHATREAFDQALSEAIDRHQPQLVVLAGFMRILTPAFIRHYQGRLLNIHPSLLPAFPGLHTHRQALQAGVRIHGCTVHFVTEQLDHGPIVAQAAVPVLPDDTEETLAARVLESEHRIYPEALRWWAEGRLTLQDDGRVGVRGAAFPQGALRVPGAAA
ncbi:MAG: phosphoribosylglycinamide formyltransferase [Betaproteobacteria bacterium]|nr:phosphoribosylglycinamide formyltransferase [Betaproteobacteria bacterium]MDE2131940.1 phosphoribosylglycinamide formyltransferase [Betaproteobacteria bacterium]MDE2212054.1 phosphoribosylglycinamide formyltransferase [Betaproteobacteria bacterium]MDE2624421.1 phosphoribosylglycinamide formyltransferase [Betaproteobacteria bacterium]